jgi:uroporphyrinogen-III decarboxylase
MSVFSAYHQRLSIHRQPTVRREEYLVGLKQEWYAQGASPDELDLAAFTFTEPMMAGVAVNTGFSKPLPEEILEDTPEMVIARDGMGRRMRLIKATATLPLPMDHPIRTMDDWQRFKFHYEFHEGRFAADWESQALAARAAGNTLCVGIPGAFDTPRQLMGEEALCLACHDDPELIHDILQTVSDTAYRVLERVSGRVAVDQLNVHEDMAGRSGCLFGPKQLRAFMQPYYLRLWGMLRERGARVFYMDSDGDLNFVIPDLLAAGLNALGPMESQAHMDIVQLRQTWGTRLAFQGGIDKFALLRGPAAIDQELSYKLPPMVRSGGCILGLDHRIPNGVTLANYRYYHRRAWEILRQTAEEYHHPIASQADAPKLG